MEKDNYNIGLEYSLKLINKYAYSKNNLIIKLNKKGISKNNVKKIISYLTKHNLINDEQLTIDYIDELINKYKGPYYIKNKLIKKGIDKELINKYINKFNKDILLSKLTDKIKLLNKNYQLNKTNNIKNKIINNCLLNGYDISDIYNIINKLNIKGENHDLY